MVYGKKKDMIQKNINLVKAGVINDRIQAPEEKVKLEAYIAPPS